MDNEVDQTEVAGLRSRLVDLLEDITPRLPTLYCTCGWGEKAELNTLFIRSITVIGQTFGKGINGSNYRKGIVTIVNGLTDEKVSKRQVKVLRRKLKRSSGYAYVIPFSFSKIVLLMISLLEQILDSKDKNQDVSFLTNGKGNLYRTYLFGGQCSAVERAAQEGEREKVVNLCSELNEINTVIRD